MNIIIIYDSIFGNTEKIAQAIRDGMEAGAMVELKQVGEVQPDDIQAYQMVIAGSPTRGFRATPAMQGFLKAIPANSLSGIKVAGFDTRLEMTKKTPWILKFLESIFGYAAKPIAGRLVEKGGSLALPPEGFFVLESEGPLKDGEVERAAVWGKSLMA